MTYDLDFNARGKKVPFFSRGNEPNSNEAYQESINHFVKKKVKKSVTNRIPIKFIKKIALKYLFF